jgi:hypothetical protein
MQGNGDACSPSAELRLREQRVVRVATSTIPSAVVAAGRDTVVVLDPALGALVAYDAARNRSFRQIPAGALRPFPSSDGVLLAADDSAVFRMGAPSWIPQQVSVIRGSRAPIMAVAQDGDHLWVATGTTGAGELWSMEAAGGNATFRGTISGATRLQPLGGGLLVSSLVNSPYTVRVLDSALREVTRLEPPRLRAPADDGARVSGVFSMGVLPLDCERLLHVLTDMRSNRRWFILYRIDATGLHVVRTRAIDEPIGIVQSIPAEHRLVAFRDGGNQREIVLYGWSWHWNPEQGGEVMKRTIAAAVLALSAMFLAGPRTAEGCVHCRTAHSCAVGGDGVQCILFAVDGEIWCNWDTGCQESMTPQDVSPAGTFIGESTVRLAGPGLDVVPCNGFIVSHVAAPGPRAQELSI